MEEFQRIIKELILQFQELSTLEQEMICAAKEKRIASIEERMIKEQAAAMRLRSLDRAREQAQKEMGYEKCTFREMLEQMPMHERMALREIYEQFRKEVHTYQEVHKDLRTLLQLNLRRIREETGNQEFGGYSGEGDAFSSTKHQANYRV
jgi:cell fate regulator YaaT (PSP1 superfamily)